MKPNFIKSSQDLQTKHRDICDGFIFQALQKTQKAIPFVKRAKDFSVAINSVSNVDELLALTDYRDDLIASCGFSDKAKSKLTQEELTVAMKKVLREVLKFSGDGFKDEIIFRYLLTKGDALGGSMRNLTGAMAGIKLINKILARLERNRQSVKILKSKTGKIQEIAWSGRVLLFDVKPKLIGKNIDLILLDSKSGKNVGSLLSISKCYLACGELKGGIDPAGADEHWKTANSALGRIRVALNKNKPALFFVGAAIEASMAEEIYSQLSSGSLTYAANLNSEDQLDDLVDWLISL